VPASSGQQFTIDRKHTLEESLKDSLKSSGRHEIKEFRDDNLKQNYDISKESTRRWEYWFHRHWIYTSWPFN